MKNIALTLLVIIFCSGCATAIQRLSTYKDQNKNTIQVTLTCDIPTAKNIVRQAIKETGFVERPELEKDNFILANIGYGNYLKSISINIFLAPQAVYTRLGFFFDYKETITTITIVEETQGATLLAHILASSRRRYELADKIKLIFVNFTKNN